MAELVEITRALELVKDFPPLQRVFLLCAGTLQGTLSAYFGVEVIVSVQGQHLTANDEISRQVILLAGGKNVCHAKSLLTIDRHDVRAKVLSQDIGIGQILEVLDVRAKFSLESVGQGDNFFWRKYKLQGDGVTYIITESFPQYWYRQT